MNGQKYAPSRRSINYYIDKFRSLDENYEKEALNQILDDLNSMDPETVNLEEKFSCIRSCCLIIRPTDAMLIGKCAQVVKKFTHKQKLNDQMVIFIIRWCLKSLTNSSDIALTEVLSVLEYLVTENVSNCKQILDDIVDILQIPLESRTKLMNPGEILLQRLNCIRAIVCSMNISHFRILKDVIIHVAQICATLVDGTKCKIILQLMEVITAMSEKNTSWLCENIGIILAISLAFASFGLPHHVESIPKYLLPTPLLCPEPKVHSASANKSKRRKQKKNVVQKINSTPLDDIVIPDLTWSQTSESDFSDSEMGRVAFLKKSERKIRLTSLSLLLYIVRSAEKKELIGFWNNILSGPYSILKTLSADTSPRSRVTITSILGILFSSNKVYLSQAQHPPKSGNLPYVSWSHLLADLITDTHNVLCDVLFQSQSVGSTLSVLQCMIIFLRNTPYHRLNDGILKNVVHSINPLMKHIDNTVRIAAIKCLTEIVIFEPNTEEQILLISSYNRDKISNRSDSWILLYCLDSIKNDKLGIVVRAECWSLLGNLMKHHFVNISCNQRLQEIVNLLQRDMEDHNLVIQQKAAKAFELIAVPLSSEMFCGVDIYDLWLHMLQGPLVPMLQSASGTLACSAADCIANISAQAFEKLPERTRIFVMTALCGCVEHEDHATRSAAVRTLGTIVIFPFLSENIQIIYDVADRIVCAMRDDNLNVRTKAAWALGNLSDVLLSGREIGVPIEEVPLLNILEQAVKTGNDHEKVKACSMRAIGNLLLLLQEHNLQIEKFRKLTVDAAATLTYNAANENNMKVRWNACYSLGNMMKNSLLRTLVPEKWQKNVIDVLLNLIASCSNFKVRQAAANALTLISDREVYSDQYEKVWPALIRAFENSQNLPEFSEYKHQRNLIDQLCLTFCHFCNLLTPEDLDHLSLAIETLAQLCHDHIVELKRRSNDAREKFQEVVNHLEQLPKAGSKIVETASFLNNIFRNDETGTG